MKRGDSKIKGGLILKNPKNDSFDAVMKMINCPGATLVILSYSSLKGFIFKLSIPKTATNCVQFNGLSQSAKIFNKSVLNLVLKLAIINNDEDDKKGEDEIEDGLFVNRIEYEKLKENAQAFMNEAKYQQDIYLKTIVPSGNPICLAIADYSYLSKTDALPFLDKLFSITSNNALSINALNYIRKNIGIGDKLGIISMELADGYTELHDLPKTDPNYEYFYLHSIAEIIISFVKLKYVNIDFHTKNILKNDETRDTRLIDFGRIADVKNPGDSGFPDDEKKSQVIRRYNYLFGNYETDRSAAVGVDIFSLYGSRINEDVICENLHKILKFYCCLDFVINSTYYYSVTHPQSILFIMFVYGMNGWDARRLVINQTSKAKFLKISETIEKRISAEHTGRNSMNATNIDNQKKNGNLLIIDKEISDYNVKYFPDERLFRRYPIAFDINSLLTINNAIILIICGLLLHYFMTKKGGMRTIGKLSFMPVQKKNILSMHTHNKNDETEMKTNILRLVVEEMKKYNPCVEIDINTIDPNSIVPISPEKYKEMIEPYMDSITTEKKTADECEIDSKIYIPDIKSILKTFSHTKTKSLNYSKSIRSLSKGGMRKTRKNFKAI